MTNQLETDLRALFAARAAEVAADVASGEAAIAARLARGDVELADVVALDRPARRRAPWLAAVAVLAAVALAAGLGAFDDRGPVVTKPVTPEPDVMTPAGIFAGEGTPDCGWTS